MLDGWHDSELVGSLTVLWRARRLLGAGEIDEDEFFRRATESAPSPPVIATRWAPPQR